MWPAEWFAALDWEAFAHFAWQFKMRPMAAAAAREAGWPGAPPAMRAAMEQAQRTCVSRNMQQIAHLKVILDAAARGGLRVIVLKGVALAARLHGDPFIRESFDLDLLVDERDCGRLDALLNGLGFRPADDHTPLTARQEAILGHFHHDKAFTHQSGAVVERHRALTVNPYLTRTDFEALWRDRAEVEVAGVKVSILGPLDLPRYLGIHAAGHAWERWKWIADLAALFAHQGDEDWRRLRAHARQNSYVALLDSWILLVAAVTDYDALPITEALQNAKARRLAQRALQISSIRRTREEIIQSPAYKRSMALYQFQLQDGLNYKLFEIIKGLHRDLDWRSWRLPDALIPLYYVIRPFAYAGRRAAALFRRREQPQHGK